ncbi:MAG: DoxX family protein [Oligoflexia bacterium]|nr:DoxX family protein [Oligoflexia bacterium]
MAKGLCKLMQTGNELAPLIARLTVGLVLLPHGLQKTLGMFGGYGFSGTMGFFTEKAGMPWIVAFLVIMAESLGSISLILGFMTRFCAASLGLVMLGAIGMVHWNFGFFMNWFGAQQGEGFEYHLLVLGLCLSLVASGAGRLSLDGKLSKSCNQ